MKKLLVLLCAMATIFASCSKEEDQSSNDPQKVLLRIGSVAPSSRAVEVPGSAVVGTITLDNGLIFITNPDEAILEVRDLIVGQATATAGQDLGRVPLNSRIMVVANVGTSSAALQACASVSEVNAVAAAIQTQANYKTVALSSGASAVGQPDATTGIALVNITLVPAISRLEIFKVKALTKDQALAKAIAAAALIPGSAVPTAASYITGFKVAGVYVDQHYPRFTFGGGNNGSIHSQGMGVDFTGMLPFMQNEGSWVAAGDPLNELNPLTAAPLASQVWAYNVASGGFIPRPIIKLTDVTYTDAAGVAQNVGDPRYVTIGSYVAAGATINAFERGKIYRIGANEGISFGYDDITTNPNPDDGKLYLHVKVNIQEWSLVTPDGVLQ